MNLIVNATKAPLGCIQLNILASCMQIHGSKDPTITAPRAVHMQTCHRRKATQATTACATESIRWCRNGIRVHNLWRMDADHNGGESMTTEWMWETIGCRYQGTYKLRTCPTCVCKHTSNFDECHPCETARLKEEEQ